MPRDLRSDIHVYPRENYPPPELGQPIILHTEVSRLPVILTNN